MQAFYSATISNRYGTGSSSQATHAHESGLGFSQYHAGVLHQCDAGLALQACKHNKADRPAKQKYISVYQQDPYIFPFLQLPGEASDAVLAEAASSTGKLSRGKQDLQTTTYHAIHRVGTGLRKS